MQINDQRLSAFAGFDVSEIYRLVEQTNANGYAFNDGGIVAGMSAVAVAIPGADGIPAAALSIAAISDRMKPERREQIASLIKREADLIGRRLDPMRGVGEAV